MAKGGKASTFWIDDDTQAIKEAFQKKHPGSNWSEFIRSAIVEKAEKDGITVYQEPVQEISVDDDVPF